MSEKIKNAAVVTVLVLAVLSTCLVCCAALVYFNAKPVLSKDQVNELRLNAIEYGQPLTDEQVDTLRNGKRSDITALVEDLNRLWDGETAE